MHKLYITYLLFTSSMSKNALTHFKFRLTESDPYGHISPGTRPHPYYNNQYRQMTLKD